MFDSHGGRKPRTTSLNNQQPSKQKCSRLVPKMGPKMGPKTGPKTGTKIGTELGTCFLFLVNKAQNWAPKTGAKNESKNGPQNGPQKQSPRTNLNTNNEGPTMSNCPASHVRTHTHKQTPHGFFLSYLIHRVCKPLHETIFTTNFFTLLFNNSGGMPM